MMSQASECLIEPSPQDWCSAKRLDELSTELSSVLPLILWAQRLDELLIQWVRREVLREAFNDNPGDLAEQNDTPLGWIDKDWSIFKRQDSLICSWCRSQLEHRLEAMFLARKSQLDRVTFRMIRVSDLDLANEIYFRIRAEEATIEELSWKYGEGAERFQGGLIKNNRLEDLPSVLGLLMTNLISKDVQIPRKLGNQFAIFQLRDRDPAVFDESMADELLMDEFNSWQSKVVELLKDHLKLSY